MQGKNCAKIIAFGKIKNAKNDKDFLKTFTRSRFIGDAMKETSLNLSDML